ncbi:MAG: malate synthase G [Janthinobacterium lividum]
MTIDKVDRAGLAVASVLQQYIEEQALPDAGVDQTAFWTGFSALVHDLAPKNRALLAERERLQAALDGWHRDHPGPIQDLAIYRQFLVDIGYLVPRGASVPISTAHVDTEIAEQAGPQLVVPLSNPRYVLNAANARWSSLYDALYGTDAIADTDGAARSSQYNVVRGERVIARGRALLDDAAPLREGSHADAIGYLIEAGRLVVKTPHGVTALREPAQWVGFRGVAEQPSAILLRHHKLHLEIQIDAEHPVGRTDAAHVKDILIEAAVSTIIDCEDSVAAVDAVDKVRLYKNWAELIAGKLLEQVSKDGKTFERSLNPDRQYTTPAGQQLTLHGRSLLMIRNVGHLMDHPAITDANGQQIPEGILDAVMTTLGAMRDLSDKRNSRVGSIYIVKPKMHGPAEVAFANELFERVEDLLRLPRHTIKIGIMDEERRTSVNLMACIQQASARIAFINTGFLDRTGDEIHSAMQAGPMVRKADMKSSRWIGAYERNNVWVGLQAGLRGRAQIGKGMWAMPDLMSAMLEQKIAHPRAGANTAWVPSPTAATLHALHYHAVDVEAVQREMEQAAGLSVEDDLLADMLSIPVAVQLGLSADELRHEVENNVQGILGYVVRWIDQGIGCSKVPDINNVGLMEDRATLRISSQHVANWLLHEVVSRELVQQALERMAVVVDKQNQGDALYQPMAVDFAGSLAFQAACSLIFEARNQTNGYTEPLLHKFRLLKKAAQADAGYEGA